MSRFVGLCAALPAPLSRGVGVRLGASVVVLALLVLGCGSDAPTRSSVDATPNATLDATPAAVPDEDALFVDVTDASGVDFTYWNGMTGRYYYAEMMGAGAALLDGDGDGDLDLFLVQGGRLGDAPLTEAVLAPPALARDEGMLVDRYYRNESTPGAIRFVDATAEAGLTALVDGASETDLPDGDLPDGDLPDDGYGMGAVAADFDADGRVDLYVTNLAHNRHLRGLGDGRFVDVTDEASAVPRWSVPATVGDFDLDGRIDLFLGHYVEWSPADEKRCSDELGQPNYCGPLSYPPQDDVLLRNLGGRFEDVSRRAGLRTARPGAALGAVVIDANADGHLDLFVANDGSANHLWINRGAADDASSDGPRFDERALLAGVAVNAQGRAEAGMGVAAGDADGDLDEDLLIGHLRRETNTLYVAEGGGSFLDRSAQSGLGAPSFDRTAFGVAWLDVDNDGKLDLAAVNGAVKVIKEQALAGDPYPLHQRDQLFRGLGGGRFAPWTDAAGAAFAPSRVSRGLVVGDLDDDGDADLIIVDNAARARVLENRVGQETAWLGLRLVAPARGEGAAPEAVVDVPGALATVSVRVGDETRRLARRVHLGSGYASSSDPRLLFGLGEAGDAMSGDELQIEDVVVTWPGGERERFAGVEPRRYTTLRRGDGAEVSEP
ncbi:MAG: CRTAC1 family protein [Acidobacteriota bacterium]